MTRETLRIIIIRHGQTASNKQKILQGHIDIPINDVGEQQASATGKYLRSEGITFDAAYSSDLTRCKQTAKLVLQEIDPDLEVQYNSKLRERFMGELQGLPVAEAQQLAAQQGKSMHDFGEAHEACVIRLNYAWDNIVSTAIDNDWSNVVLFSHGGVISKFVAHTVNDKEYKLSDRIKPSDLRVPHNCSLTIVEIDKITKAGGIKMFGDASHLSVKENVDQNVL